MSAISSPAQPVSTGGGGIVPPEPDAEIDASCRTPVLFLFVSAAVWLLIGSIFGIIATLKFHAPGLLADCPWLTYGRVHPAHMNSLIYGFAAQAALGVTLWMMAHLGRTRLAFGPGVFIGGIFWNIGVTVGVLGILCGDSTGYEWLEMPGYASVPIFCAYVVIALGAMVTFHQRRERRFYISQWFLLAALFWFPWIYSTANLLLVARPVRGALQAAIGHWYVNNLTNVWFGFIGLGALFYFVPKIIKRPLASHYLGIMIFWLLGFFGSWGGIPEATPLPSWMPAMSTVAAMLTLVPVIGVGVMLRKTFAGDHSALRGNAPLKFMFFGVEAYIVAGVAGAIASVARFNEITNFTWFVPAQSQLMLYGFFGMTMFGAIYYIAPRLANASFPSPKRISVHLWLAGLGILIYAVALAFGGAYGGITFNSGAPFTDVMTATLPFLRVSTTGDFLMALAHVLFLANLIGLVTRAGRASLSAAWAANAKTVGVAS